MSFLGKLSLIFLAALSLGLLSGCSPSDQSQEDEEKEPHFVLGNNRFNTMDYPGAIEAFEQSLEVNPHSAAAHYQHQGSGGGDGASNACSVWWGCDGGAARA